MAYNDTFTNTNGTLLSAHTSDSGSSYSGAASSFVIHNNAVYNSVAGTQLAIIDDIQLETEYDLTVNITAVSKTNNIGVIWSVGNGIGSNDNFYHLRADSGNSGRLQLYKSVNGTLTQLGSNYAVTATGPLETIKIRHRSTGIEVDYGANANVITSSLDVAIANSGKLGIRAFNAGSASTGYHLDEFVFANASALSVDSTPASITPGEAFDIIISGPASVPTLINTIVKIDGSGGEVIILNSITGSDPYTLNCTVATTSNKKYTSTGYTLNIDVDGEEVLSSPVPYIPPTGYSFVDLTGVGSNPIPTDIPLSAGDQIEWQTATTPSGFMVVIDDQAEDTITGGNPAGESYQARAWDATDETWGAVGIISGLGGVVTRVPYFSSLIYKSLYTPLSKYLYIKN